MWISRTAMVMLIFAVTLAAYVIHYRPLDMEGVGSGDVSRYLASGISLLASGKEMRNPIPYHIFDDQELVTKIDEVMAYPNIFFQLMLGVFYKYDTGQVDFGYLYAIPLLVRFAANLLVFYLLGLGIEKKWAFAAVLAFNILPIFHLYNYVMQGVNTDSVMVFFVLASIYSLIRRYITTSALVAVIGYYFRSHMWMTMLSSIAVLSALGRTLLIKYIAILLFAWLVIRYSLPMIFDLRVGHDAGASFYGGYYYHFSRDWSTFASRVWPVCKDFMEEPILLSLLSSLPIIFLSFFIKPVSSISKRLAAFTLMFLFFVILGSVILDFSEPGNRQVRYFVYPFVLGFITMTLVIGDMLWWAAQKYRIAASPLWLYSLLLLFIIYTVVSVYQRYQPNMFAFKAVQIPSDVVQAMTPLGTVMGGIPVVFYIGSVMPVAGAVVLQPNKPLEFYNGRNNKKIETIVLHKRIPFTLGRLPCCSYDNEWVGVVNNCAFIRDGKHTVFRRVIYKNDFSFAVYKRITNIDADSLEWLKQDGIDCLTPKSTPNE